MAEGLTFDTRYFDDVEPGDEFADDWQPHIEEVREYIGLEEGPLGFQGRFVDPDEAKRLGFERPIVPGAMSMSRLSRLVTDWMGRDGRLESIDVDFRRPVLHDDEIRCIGLVTDTTEGDSGPQVKLDIYLENTRGERPLQGVAVVGLPRRPS